MRHLTELMFEVADERDHRILAEYLSLLTRLRSLTLTDTRRSSILPEIEEGHLMALTQLTQLSLNIDRSDRYLRLPTGIQSLHISCSGSSQSDFVEILMSMTNLSSLSIDAFSENLCLFRRHSVTPSQFSQEIGRMQNLSIQNVLIDDLFLEALGMLTRLTSLIIADDSRSPVDPYLVCPRLSNLSKLMELEISFQRVSYACDGEFPQLCLPKLRKLDLPLSGVDANMCKSLLKTLPCLRKMALSGKTVDL